MPPPRPWWAGQYFWNGLTVVEYVCAYVCMAARRLGAGPLCGGAAPRANYTVDPDTGLRKARDIFGLLLPGEFAQVIDYAGSRHCGRAVGVGCRVGADHGCLQKDVLARLGDGVQMAALDGVAVSFRVTTPPFVYGHLYATVMGFTEALLARRDCVRTACSPVRVFLHDSSGLETLPVVRTFMQKASKLSSEGLFAEVAALFTEAIGVRIQLRTWVPHCGRLERFRSTTCLMRPVPLRMRGRFALLANVPTANPMKRSAALEFRSAVFPSLRLGEAKPLDTALFVSNTNATNQRRIINEDELGLALAAHFAAQHPRLRFAHRDLQALPFLEEVRLFRRSRIVIALFGSVFWNCLYMGQGSVVVQIHGALKDDVDCGAAWGWCKLCRLCSVGWVPHIVPGAMPTWKNCSRAGSRLANRCKGRAEGTRVYWHPHHHTARVAAGGLIATVEAALRGEHAARHAAFARHLLQNPDVRVPFETYFTNTRAEARACIGPRGPSEIATDVVNV